MSEFFSDSSTWSQVHDCVVTPFMSCLGHATTEKTRFRCCDYACMATSKPHSVEEAVGRAFETSTACCLRSSMLAHAGRGRG